MYKQIIQTREDVKVFFNHLINERQLFDGFHPDTPIKDYINTETRKPTFTRKEAEHYQLLLLKCFRTAIIKKFDIYELCSEFFGPSRTDGRSGEDTRRVWDFVAKYYPDYDHSNDIAHADDLQKLVDKEFEEGDGAHRLLISDFGGDINNPAILHEYDEVHRGIYARCIEEFLNSK